MAFCLILVTFQPNVNYNGKQTYFEPKNDYGQKLKPGAF